MKRYAVCGVSNRAISMFLKPICTTFSEHAQLVAVLDIDARRFAVMHDEIPTTADVPCFKDSEFDQLVATAKPDVIIVAGRDSSHVDYILAALAKDLDVITEKPMVTTSADCKRVLDAEQQSKGKVTVTFNARYPAVQRRIKELILDDKVGRITSVELNWYIDTFHGASYFKRWNRMRAFSGGLSIHKSTHHLDMVQWLIDQYPEEAFCHAARNYYGAEGPLNPSKQNGRHCSSCTEKVDCAYYSRWSTRSSEVAPQDDHLGSVASNRTVGNYTDYSPDMCIFDQEIDIEDTYSATVRFKKGAFLSYTANFSSPFEGYRLAINGNKGRIETQQINARGAYEIADPGIDYYPLFGAKENYRVLNSTGSHGGADPLLQEDLFLGVDPKRPYEIMAASEAGAYAVALGEALWRSSETHQPINIDKLLQGDT